MEAADTQGSWYEEVLEAERSYTVHSESGEHIGNAFLQQSVPEDIPTSLTYKKVENRRNSQAKASKLKDTTTSSRVREAGAALRQQHGRQSESKEATTMSDQDRYIDARLAGIEKDLDNRLADMQRQSDQADKRQDKALVEMRAEGKMTRTTVITTSVAVVGLVAGILFGTLTAFQQTVSEQGEAMRQSVSEQSSWLRQSVDRIERRVEATPVSLSTENQPAPAPEQEVPSE